MKLIKHTDNEYYLLGDEYLNTRDWTLRPDGVILRMTDTEMIHYLDSESTAAKKIMASTKKLDGLPMLMSSQLMEFGINNKPEWEVEVELSWNPIGNYCDECGNGGKYLEKPCDNVCRNHQPKITNGYVNILNVK